MASETTARTGGISFDLDDETELILTSLDEFIEQEVAPVAEDIAEILDNPRLGHHDDGRLTDEMLEALQTVRQRSADAGFYAMNLPEEYGGQDVSAVTWYVVNRHLAAKDQPLASHVLAGPEGPKPLLLQAEGEQVEEYLEPAIQAEKSTAFAQTEPGVGSDSPNMATTAEKDGGEWVINGRKQWITNAPYADFVQVFARTTPQEETGRYGGITCFIVEEGEFEIGSFNNAVGSEGTQAEVLFDDVRVSEDRVLGSVDNAFYNAMEFLSLGRVELGARAIGGAELLLEKAIEYAQDREAFGRPIGKFQQISSMVAEARARTYAADTAGLRTAWKMDAGQQVIEEASILKWLGTQTYWQMADAAVQIHGANGLSEENPFMDHLHQARILRIVEGTDEIQLNTIAKQNGLL
ncbi:MAG: acyl-CoA dehydrogenase family protein [Natrialbaceae archaeon]|nr:acyl-CoA dehydrogenase family protein [Natrialbaceae archaeon]